MVGAIAQFAAEDREVDKLVNYARLGMYAHAALHAIRFRHYATYACLNLAGKGPVIVCDWNRTKDQNIANKAAEVFLAKSFDQQKGRVYGPDDPEGALRAAAVIAHCMQSTRLGSPESHFCASHLPDAKKAHTEVYHGECAELVSPQPPTVEINYCEIRAAVEMDSQCARAGLHSLITDASLQNAVQILQQEAEAPGKTKFYIRFEKLGDLKKRMDALEILHGLRNNAMLTQDEQMIRAMHALWVCSAPRDEERPRWANEVCEKEIANALRMYNAAAPADRPHGTLGLVLCGKREGPFAQVPAAWSLDTLGYLIAKHTYHRDAWHPTGAARIAHLLAHCC